MSILSMGCHGGRPQCFVRISRHQYAGVYPEIHLYSAAKPAAERRGRQGGKLFSPCPPREDVTGSILKLVMCCEDPDHLRQCQRFFPPEFCNFAFASRTFVDVVAAGFGKGDAIQTLSRLLTIPLSHFFSAGDAYTDLPSYAHGYLLCTPERCRCGKGHW